MVNTQTTTTSEEPQARVQCSICNLEIDEEDAYNFNDNYYCQECYNENVFSCDGCGYDYDVQDGNFLNDNRYCDECYIQAGEDEENNNEENNNNYDIIELPFKKEKSKSFKVNPFRNYCGVEIETLNNNLYENTFNKTQLQKYGFSQDEDGSLGKDGVEFYSLAYNGDLLTQKVKAFCEELNKRDYYVKDSCGLHVHIEIPYKTEYIKKVLLFYSKYEQYFFNMVSQSRRNNSYCKKIGNSNLQPLLKEIKNVNNMAELQSLFYSHCTHKSLPRQRLKISTSGKWNDNRYSWVNLHSIFYRGTLEIRLHNGTINAEKINNWFLLHLTSLNFIHELSLKTIELLPNTFEFFLSIFPIELQKYIQERINKFEKATSED